MRGVLLAIGVFLCSTTAAQAQHRLAAHAAILTASTNAHPTIASYSPGFGLPGTAVTITGTGFGATQGSSYLSTVSAVTKTLTTWTPTNWNDTEIVVSVPASMPNGLVYLNVTVKGLRSVDTEPFTVGVPPNITSYSPLSGPPGTMVTIHGTGFGPPVAGSRLSVQSARTNAWTTWTPTSWSDTEIVASVPASVTNGLVYLNVTANKLRSIGTYGFQVGIAPVVTGYSPGFGPPGTVVTILGTKFGPRQGGSDLYILSAVTNAWTTWKPISWSDTEIVASVPSTTPLGKVYLVIEVDEVQSLGWHAFTVGIPPLITNYSPPSGPSGTVLTIHGTGFGLTQGTSYVSVLSPAKRISTAWTPTSWSDTEISVTVPSTMPPGKVYLSVTVDRLQSIESQPFTVGIPPAITSYSPGFGPPGTVLTIHGTGFGLAEGSSNLSVLSALTNTWTTWTPTSWSDTEIVASVPGAMPNGLIYLFVTVDGLQNIETEPFTVGVPPSITAYSAASGPPGTLLTIHGTGFGSVQGGSHVLVLSPVTNASTTWMPTSWSDTQIAVLVPSTMPRGLVYLCVVVDGLRSLDTDPFTVGVPPSITAYSAASGPPGTLLTIRGTGFGSVQGGSHVSVLSAVTNTSTTWMPTSWSDTQIAVVVPNTMPNGPAYLFVTVDGLRNVGTYPFNVH
jgi:hypothetical protein